MARTILAAMVLLWTLPVDAAEKRDRPEIVFASVDYDDPAFPVGLLRISGSGFGHGAPRSRHRDRVDRHRPERAEAPVVFLSGVELSVLGSTDTDITAELPPSLGPGTYKLVVMSVVRHRGRSDSFDVTIGTQGPEGPRGPAGATGDTGPQGPPGNLGLAGQSCQADRFVTGFDANGSIVCSCLDLDDDGFSPDGGACGPLDCSDQNPLIFPGALEVCFDGIDNNCDGQIDETCTGSGEVDIVFVIDNSGSMSEEANAVERNINDLGSTLEAAGIDYRIIMLTTHGGFSTEICVPPPLGSSNCSASPVSTDRFFHYSANVQSHDSLCKILNTFDGGEVDEFNLFPGGWQGILRPTATKAFIEVSDDGTSCNFGGVTYNDGNSVAGGEAVATDFDAALLGLSPLQFGTQVDRNYLFYSIIALEELPAGAATPHDPTLPVTLAECSPGAVDPGTGYQSLSRLTGALRFPMCRPDLYGAIFQGIASDLLVQLSR